MAKTDEKMYRAASRLMNKSGTRKDARIAGENELTVVLPDCDGPYHSPTDKFIALQRKVLGIDEGEE